MLKKLRIKFVAIVMACVAVVLAVVFTGICVSEYQRSMSEVQSALDASLNRAVESAFSHREVRETIVTVQGDGALSSSGGPSMGDMPIGREGMGPEAGQGQYGPRIGGRDEEERSLVPVGVYSLDGSGSLTVVSEFTTALIGDDVIDSVESEVRSAEDGSGEISEFGLVYQKRTLEDMTYVAFADSSYASSWQSLALTLVIAAIIVLAVFFVIAFMLSKWALKPVEEAWNSQRQFVADASHELKTPLTVILANTSILLKHPEQSIANQSQWIESTQVEAESMQGLVNEMLELAQVESRANIQHELVDLSDLVDMETLQFESVAFERGCQFSEAVQPDLEVSGDEQRLRKMTSTLIENALKYVDDGGLVTVELSASSGKATMRIANTGSTISAEDLPHIFDRFYRTDKARTSGTGGFGLGLAIAREIAREHGGDITCASDEGRTVFTVTLPLLS